MRPCDLTLLKRYDCFVALLLAMTSASPASLLEEILHREKRTEIRRPPRAAPFYISSLLSVSRTEVEAQQGRMGSLKSHQVYPPLGGQNLVKLDRYE